MTNRPDLVIEPLGKKHNRTVFSCGTDELDTYLQRQASQDTKRRISRIFVIRSEEDDQTILGYYTLSALSIDLSSLPSDLAKKLPKHPLPAALIGRLAVSTKSQGTGLGKVLLADAIKRTLALSDEIGRLEALGLVTTVRHHLAFNQRRDKGRDAGFAIDHIEENLLRVRS